MYNTDNLNKKKKKKRKENYLNSNKSEFLNAMHSLNLNWTCKKT